jgi:uncharacterized membrane protein YuzA (DUF378 family)
MGDYLSFKKLCTPYLVPAVFWLAVVFNTIDALFGGHGFFEAVFYLIVGPILIRIICEVLIEAFKISETLGEIRDEQRKQAVQAMFKPEAAPTTTTPPPVV